MLVNGVALENLFASFLVRGSIARQAADTFLASGGYYCVE